MKRLLEAERAALPFLVWRDRAGEQQIVTLSQPRVSAGRSTSNDVVLAADPEASRVHAELKQLGGAWTVVDDGLSRNGTFVDGRRLSSRCRLEDGNVIRMGQTNLTFRDPARGTTAVTAPGTAVRLQAPLNDTQRRILTALCTPYAGGDAYAAPATNAEIAAAVFLGVDAVKGHLRQLYRLFGVSDLPQIQKRARLAELALHAGFGRPPA